MDPKISSDNEGHKKDADLKAASSADQVSMGNGVIDTIAAPDLIIIRRFGARSSWRGNLLNRQCR